MSYQVLARKWRPRDFSQMVGQEHVLRALINALDENRLHHAFLFTGTRGVGKTTIARILAKSLNCEQGVSSRPCGECAACREIDEGRFVDLIEVDAASRTKVEDTRELLENVQYAPTRGRYKVYLIDEVHMLSNHSFNALLKTLEEPPPHVKFLLATTDPQKLPVTILSRCLQFNLKRLPLELIRDHLDAILGKEGIEVESGALTEIARAADGSMRDALSLLDQAIAYGGGRLALPDVREMLGSIERDRLYALLSALAAADTPALFAEVAQLAEQSPDFSSVLNELNSLLQRIALAQRLPEAVDDSLGDRELLLDLAGRLGPEDVQLYYQIGITGRRDLPLAPDPRSGFEMTLLRMLAFRPDGLAAAPAAAAPKPAAKATPAPEAPAVAAPPAQATPEAGLPPQRETSPAAAPQRASGAEMARQVLRGEVQAPPPPPEPSRVPPAEYGMPPEPPLEEPPPPFDLPPSESVPGGGQSDSSPEPAPVVTTELPAIDLSEQAEGWGALVDSLDLHGMDRQFAMHCALVSRDGNRYELAIDPRVVQLRSAKREKALQQALEQKLAGAVTLSMTEAENDEATPEQRRILLEAKRQRAAEEQLEQDPAFKALTEQFAARLEPGSVTPLI